MQVLLKISLFYLCLQATLSNKITYKAAVVNGDLRNGLKDYISKISKASEQVADIMLLTTGSDSGTSNKACDLTNNEELVRDISSLAKNSAMYIVTDLHETVRCAGEEEVIRNDLVFDRKGDVIAVYRTPVNDETQCNITTSKMREFTTDFGVTFSILTEEDIILQNLQNYRTKNFIITGSSNDIAYVEGNQLILSLAYKLKANVICGQGVFAGRAGLKAGNGAVFVINKYGADKSSTLSFNPTDLRDMPAEDMSRYTIRPLNLEASSRGYKEYVCYGQFCCEFFVKTGPGVNAQDAHYALSVQSGHRQLGARYIAVETCELVVCTVPYKRSSSFGLENNVNVTFEKISVKGNFSNDNSAQFPILLATQKSLLSDHLAFESKPFNDVNEVSIVLKDAKNILKFGILGRDYTKDFHERFNSSNTDAKSDVASYIDEYIFNEDFVDLFDYLWIRVRILMVIVSIYILEMM